MLEADHEYEKFPEPVVEEVKKGEGDEGEDPEEVQPPPEEDGGEPKAPTFKKEDYKWTVTDKKSKNMP